MSKIVTKSAVAHEAAQLGVHPRSPRHRGTVSNLYDLVKSLAKVATVLMRTELLEHVAQELADALSLHGTMPAEIPSVDTESTEAAEPQVVKEEESDD